MGANTNTRLALSTYAGMDATASASNAITISESVRCTEYMPQNCAHMRIQGMREPIAIL